MLNKELGAGKLVLSGLVEHEAERADIYAVAASLAGIHEFYVAVLVEPELQSLRGIVDFCRYHGVGQLDVFGKLLIDIK